MVRVPLEPEHCVGMGYHAFVHDTLRALEPLVGKRCQATHRAEEQPALVFDWTRISPNAREAFVSEIFGDWSPDEGGPLGELVSLTAKGDLAWRSERYVPFALLGVDSSLETWRFRGGDGYPQFNQLLIADVESKVLAVVALDVDGTVIPPKSLAPTFPSLEELGLGLQRKKKEAKAPRGKVLSDQETAASLEKAVGSLLTPLSDYKLGKYGLCYGKINPAWKDIPKDEAKASAALPKFERAIAKVERLIASSALFSKQPTLAALSRDYRALLERVQREDVADDVWRVDYIDRLQHDERFFRGAVYELHHGRPLESYADSLATKR